MLTVHEMAHKSLVGEDSDELQWKTLSLTHVVYPRGDLYGKFLALFTMLPFAVVVTFTALALFVRDVHVISFFIGQLANEMINLGLKHYVREPRPSQMSGEESSGYGWPSSHCQFQSFFLTYSSLCIWLRLKHTHPLLPRTLLTILNLLAFTLILQSRIYLRYHYPHQCWHAIMLGSCLAMAWFLVVVYLLEPYLWTRVLRSECNSNYLWLVSRYLTLNTGDATIDFKQD